MNRNLCLTVAVLSLSTHSHAQDLYVAPSLTEADRIRLLTGPTSNQPLSLELRAYGRGDTDVAPIGPGSRKHIGKTELHADRAYLLDFRNTGLALERGRWRAGYFSTQADLYSGNHDAGQIYLDSLAHMVDFTALASPSVNMNRTEADRFDVGYSTPMKIAGRKGALMMTGSYLYFHRIQLGSLQGQTTNGQFHGDLHILTTLGLDPGEHGGDGLSFDTAFALELNPRWRVALSAENLFSYVHQQTLKQIDATVTTNTLEPDGNGFLHGVPLLQGSVSKHSYTGAIRRRLDLGAGYRESGRDWMLWLRNDIDWRLTAALNVPRGKSGRIWGMLALAPFEWIAGYDTGNFGVELGLSGTDFDTAKRATIALKYRVALGR